MGKPFFSYNYVPRKRILLINTPVNYNNLGVYQLPSGREVSPKVTIGARESKALQEARYYSSKENSRRLLPPLSWSPSLSEGGLNCFINIRTNGGKILINLTICKAYNLKLITFQNFCTELVFFYTFVCIMLRSIQFNNQICLTTIKIRNELINCFLSLETNLIFCQKVIPQTIFLRRCIFSKTFCKYNIFGIIS